MVIVPPSRSSFLRKEPRPPPSVISPLGGIPSFRKEAQKVSAVSSKSIYSVFARAWLIALVCRRLHKQLLDIL